MIPSYTIHLYVFFLVFLSHFPKSLWSRGFVGSSHRLQRYGQHDDDDKFPGSEDFSMSSTVKSVKFDQHSMDWFKGKS